jgi:hypothetical protein
VLKNVVVGTFEHDQRMAFKDPREDWLDVRYVANWTLDV